MISLHHNKEVYLIDISSSTSKTKAVSNEAQYPDYMEVLQNCTKENKITLERYIQASKTRNNNADIECVDACMFKIYKILNPDGTIDLQKAIEHLVTNRPGVQRDVMQKNIELCSMKKEDNECHTARNLMNCALGH
ncbi:PREDICTED: uncharacterized protein LOC105367999 [Ceratosolen solmsi marchali]|uniref:Uncharacterized protein LOC105367999 n=1 Tax=Ceratosolen solmsi marchali TaxID=326594 RepID=A0AAJ7E292_9HYME|nr:PREDICTED: uncharacterized protein LOC105367999 [Ceratosolen solmsi marchali]